MFADMSEAQFADILGRVHVIGSDLAPKIAHEFYSGSLEIPVVLNGPRENEPAFQVMLWACKRAKEMRGYA